MIHSDIHDENLVLVDARKGQEISPVAVDSGSRPALASSGSQLVPLSGAGTKMSDCDDANILPPLPGEVVLATHHRPTETISTSTEVKNNPVSVKKKFGILDFGDVVYTCVVFELASAVAYAMMQEATNGDSYLDRGKAVIDGFCSKCDLCPLERRVLFACVCARYCTELLNGEVEVRNQNAVTKHGQNLDSATVGYIKSCEEDGWQQLENLLDLGSAKFEAYWFQGSS